MTWINSEDVIAAIDSVYGEYAKGVRMNTTALVNFVFHRMDPKGILTPNMEALIIHTIKLEIDAGNLVMTIGKNGGISQNMFGVLPHAQTSAGDSKSSVAVNDHTCKSCGNDRVSKCEKSCWKCGNSLHG